MNTENEAIISLENVSVRYKRRGGIFRKAIYHEALKDITLDIYRGETLGVIGRNGAGKSTLLKTIAGVIKPDDGVVYNRGVSVSLLALQAGFDSELSGLDNAVFNGMLLGYSRKQVISRLNDIQKFSGLEEFFYEPVKTYSSGMKSRLGFSVSVFLKPDVLLLDEVLSVGDKDFKKQAESEIIRAMLSQDQTVVLVSHSAAQIDRLCDRKIEIG